MATLKNHPGFWMRDDAAAAFDAFEDKYGVQKVNSAGRYVWEQNELIHKYYVIGGPANRPPYLYPPARPAEASNHVANGGIAVDMARAGDLREELAEFGFEWYGSSDPVHYTFRGWSGGRAGYQDGSVELGRFQEKLIRMGHDLGPTGADKVFGPKTKAATLHEQQMAEKNGYPGGNVADDGIPGPKTEAYLDWWLVGRHQGKPVGDPLASSLQWTGIQRMLKKFDGYTGKIDNIAGDGTLGAFDRFLKRSGFWDGNRWSSAQRWLKARWGYAGNIDRDYGPGTRAAWARAEAANNRDFANVK